MTSAVAVPGGRQLAPTRAPEVDEICVVICAYTLRRWADLQRAVASVLAQTRPVGEIIVVVDHNHDLLALALTRWPAGQAGPARQVRVVESSGRPGLSGARNAGAQLARAGVVAFLDDDAEAEAGWSECLLSLYADPSVLACGGAVLPRLAGRRPAWWPVEFDWVVGCSYLGLPTAVADVRNVIGANMSVRRGALMGLDGFAEGVGRIGALPFGCEETDLCIRMSQRWPAGRIVYQPAARVHHTVPVERLSWGYFRTRCFAEGVSKARVAARVGSAPALASEFSYTLRVLSRGVGRGLGAASRGDSSGGRRAAAIAAGLAITTAGYVRGAMTRRPVRCAPDPAAALSLEGAPDGRRG